MVRFTANATASSCPNNPFTVNVTLSLSAQDPCAYTSAPCSSTSSLQERMVHHEPTRWCHQDAAQLRQSRQRGALHGERHAVLLPKRSKPFTVNVTLLCRNVKRFRGGLTFQAHRLVYESTLGWRVIKRKRERPSPHKDVPRDIRTRRSSVKEKRFWSSSP